MVSQPTKFEMPSLTRSENMKGVAKCRKWGGYGSPKVIENCAIR